ncbi:AraC family transcriptional regulator [Paenibacillus sp. strain BS8-2]
MSVLQWKDYGNEYAEFLYRTPSDWELEQTIWVVRGGQSITKTGYHAGARRMDCYSLHLITEGELILREDNREVKLAGGDLFCKFKDRSYSYYRPDSCNKATFSWLAFDGPGAESLLGKAGMTPETPYICDRINDSLQDILAQLFGLMRSDPSGESLPRALQTQSVLHLFFSQLIDSLPVTSRPPAREWVKQSIRYIELHGSEGLTVEQLAELVGMNRNYFSTAFAEHTGISPLQYLTKVRMKRAAKLLDDSAVPIAEVAYSLGYANPFAFTRAFAKYAGMPPSAYRKRNQIQ